MPITKIRGNTQIKPLTITDSEVAANAAIQLSKLAEGLELIKRNGSIAFTGDIDAGNNKLINLLTPTNSNDATNKSYVDSLIANLDSDIQEVAEDLSDEIIRATQAENTLQQNINTEQNQRISADNTTNLRIDLLSLDQLTDVAVSGNLNGQVLTYDSAANLWKNVSPPAAPVTSVNAKTGVVILTASDVGAAEANHTHPIATQTISGFMSFDDKVKLDGVQAGAEVNVNADWNANIGDAQILNKPVIPSVIDNLTSTSATDALSANQGKTLQDNKAEKSVVDDINLDLPGRSPVFTYTAGILTRLDYSNGDYKTFAYTEGNLTELKYYKSTVTITKVFNYNPDGSLANITQTQV
jgi:hypothetical protein